MKHISTAYPTYTFSTLTTWSEHLDILDSKCGWASAHTDVSYTHLEMHCTGGSEMPE